MKSKTPEALQGNRGEMLFGTLKVTQMTNTTITKKCKPAVPLFDWANRHRRRPHESIAWTVDRHCMIANYRREARS